MNSTLYNLVVGLVVVPLVFLTSGPLTVDVIGTILSFLMGTQGWKHSRCSGGITVLPKEETKESAQLIALLPLLVEIKQAF